MNTEENRNNRWIGEVKKRFKKGDKVRARIRFGNFQEFQEFKGKVEGVYPKFVLVDFGKFRRSFMWHEIYQGVLKPAR